MSSKVTPVLIVLLVVAAFFIGMFWTKIQYLEGNQSGTKNVAVNNSPQPSSAAVPEQKVLTAKEAAEIAKVGLVKGPASAKITIVEFSDFECPFCGKVQPTIKQIFDTYGDKVRLVFRQYPLPFHPRAIPAGNAAMCANEQNKFWEYHDKLFANQTNLTDAELKQYAIDLGLDSAKFDTCLSSNKYQNIIDTDKKAGDSVGVSGTPAFFINGRLLAGAYPFSEFKKIIDEELAK